MTDRTIGYGIIGFTQEQLDYIFKRLEEIKKDYPKVMIILDEYKKSDKFEYLVALDLLVNLADKLNELEKEEYKQLEPLTARILKQCEKLEYAKSLSPIDYVNNLIKENEKLKTQYNCYSCGNCKGGEDYINMARHTANAIKTNHKYLQTLDEIEKELINFCSDCDGKEDNVCEKGCYYSLIPTFKNIINKAKDGE